MLQQSLLQKGYSIHGGNGQTPITAVEIDIAKSTEDMLVPAGLELRPVLKGGGVLLGSMALTFKGFWKRRLWKSRRCPRLCHSGNKDLGRQGAQPKTPIKVEEGWEKGGILKGKRFLHH